MLAGVAAGCCDVWGPYGIQPPVRSLHPQTNSMEHRLQCFLQVSQLEAGMWESRVRSSVQLLGRAPVQEGEAGINAAAATVSEAYQ